MRRYSHFACTAFLVAMGAYAQNLPDGNGKAETVRVCSQCHEVARAISLHQDRAGWQGTIDKMMSLGAKGTPAEFQVIGDYLAKNYPAEDIPKIHINSARAIELEAGLTLRRSQAAAVIAYREKHGNFKSLEDLKKVPGLDAAQIDSKKDRLAFD